MNEGKLNFWIEWVDESGDKHPLRDNGGNIMYFSKIDIAEAAIKAHDLKAEIVKIVSGNCGREIPCMAHPGGQDCAVCSMGKIYTEKGFKDRKDYLNSLADNYGISIEEVDVLADMLGPNEDFDGLVASLENYIAMDVIEPKCAKNNGLLHNRNCKDCVVLAKNVFDCQYINRRNGTA